MEKLTREWKETHYSNSIEGKYRKLFSFSYLDLHISKHKLTSRPCAVQMRIKSETRGWGRECLRSDVQNKLVLRCSNECA